MPASARRSCLRDRAIHRRPQIFCACATRREEGSGVRNQGFGKTKTENSNVGLPSGPPRTSRLWTSLIPDSGRPFALAGKPPVAPRRTVIASIRREEGELPDNATVLCYQIEIQLLSLRTKPSVLGCRLRAWWAECKATVKTTFVAFRIGTSWLLSGSPRCDCEPLWSIANHSDRECVGSHDARCSTCKSTLGYRFAARCQRSIHEIVKSFSSRSRTRAIRRGNTHHVESVPFDDGTPI